MGDTQKTAINTGVSLVEVLVALLISGILYGVMSVGFPTLNRSVQGLVRVTTFSEPYLIFLMKFEEEYQLSDADSSAEKEQVNRLNFMMDTNLDGDYEDSAESVQYRWNSEERRIDRKSGDGYYQAILDLVSGFDWKPISDDPFCHELTVEDSLSQVPRKTIFCK